MHINYLYMLHRAEQINRIITEAKILDYGCGAGEVVLAGRKHGLDIYGADVFYKGSNRRKTVEEIGLLGNIIQEINDGRLQFDNGYFDLILSNQVFEHVENIDAVLAEINRVMKKGATLVCLFPSKKVIREGHIGIPFVHWFSKGSQTRYYYTLILRSIGFGYLKGEESIAQWTRDKLDWIDKYTIYREENEIFRSFSQYFEISEIEDDYIRFRLSKMNNVINSVLRRFVFLQKLFFVRRCSQIFFHRFAGMVILAKKR
jgi:ubiquinone/menaquinone biosynthesis C-methylase UbiE